LTSKEDLQALKHSGRLMFQQVPLLSIADSNGKVELQQSWACVRYVADRFGCWPEGQTEKAVADATCEFVRDFEQTAGIVANGWGERAEDVAKITAARDRFFPRLEQFLAGRSGGAAAGGFAVGPEPCVADYVLLNAVLNAQDFVPDLCASYPVTASLRDRIAALPHMASYLQSNRRHGPVDEDYKERVVKIFG